MYRLSLPGRFETLRAIFGPRSNDGTNGARVIFDVGTESNRRRFDERRPWIGKATFPRNYKAINPVILTSRSIATAIRILEGLEKLAAASKWSNAFRT